MDLWIRSQNKELLIPNPKLSLEDIKNAYWIIDIFDDTVLGTYKSKERALEVLDEIQNKIKGIYLLKPETLINTSIIEEAKDYYEKLNNIDIITCDNNFTITPINSNVIVYEIPKE